MKYFVALASLVCSFMISPARAATCAMNAALVTAAMEKFDFRVGSISLTGNEFVITYASPPNCAPGLEFDVHADQNFVRGLVDATGTGDVLFVTARIEYGSLKVKLSGDAKVLAKVAEEWRTRGNLSRVITGITARWWADYETGGIIMKPAVLRELAADCRPGVAATMKCGEFYEWGFTTSPQCLRDERLVEALGRTIRFEDPYVGGTNPNVKIWGVAHDLCLKKHARVPWVRANGDALLFGTSMHYERREFAGPAMIEAKGQIQW